MPLQENPSLGYPKIMPSRVGNGFIVDRHSDYVFIFSLVPKLQLENAVLEDPASRNKSN